MKKINYKFINKIIIKKTNDKFKSNSNPYAIKISLSNIKKYIIKLKKNFNLKNVHIKNKFSLHYQSIDIALKR